MLISLWFSYAVQINLQLRWQTFNSIIDQILIFSSVCVFLTNKQKCLLLKMLCKELKCIFLRENWNKQQRPLTVSIRDMNLLQKKYIKNMEAHHTGIHLLHPHNLFGHRTAKRWRCSSLLDTQSGPPHTSAPEKLGQTTTESHPLGISGDRTHYLSLSSISESLFPPL